MPHFWHPQRSKPQRGRASLFLPQASSGPRPFLAMAVELMVSQGRGPLCSWEPLHNGSVLTDKLLMLNCPRTVNSPRIIPSTPSHSTFSSVPSTLTEVPVPAQTFLLWTPWAVVVSGTLSASPVNSGVAGIPIQHLLLVKPPWLLIQKVPWGSVTKKGILSQKEQPRVNTHPLRKLKPCAHTRRFP